MADEYRIAINGYGRIGQNILRALYADARWETLKVVAINELADLDTLTYLTRYDTTHGHFPARVENDGADLLIDGDRIRVIREALPERMPWAEYDVDLIMECTGSFTDCATAHQHLQRGARRLLFSQPADDGVDATIVHGFNTADLRPDHRLVSNASCTSNCLVHVLAVLDKAFGIESGVTTTIHSAMNDQPTIDRCQQGPLRLTRSAMHSMVPVDTGLGQGIAKFFPHLTNRIQCLHLRVPTINVSVMDLAINVRREVDVRLVNDTIREAAEGYLQGVMGYTEDPHVSTDFNTDPRSAIVDASQTRVSCGHLIKMMVWFDNEWSYANRMLDVAHAWLSLAGRSSKSV
jgi:D-erythrose 4-phosphate dehydrogenase